MQKAKQRSEIAQQDKWRIEDIYATDEAWEADYNECIRRAKEKCVYQGRLAESALILYQALKESDEADLLVEHVYVYAFMKYYRGYCQCCVSGNVRQGAGGCHEAV